jgi:excisionase family DNA binding protein
MSIKPVLRMLPPQRVADSDQIAPLQFQLKDAARLLAISNRTLQRWIKEGRMSATGRGKLRRVEYAELLRVLEELRRDGRAV